MRRGVLAADDTGKVCQRVALAADDTGKVRQRVALAGGVRLTVIVDQTAESDALALCRQCCSESAALKTEQAQR